MLNKRFGILLLVVFCASVSAQASIFKSTRPPSDMWQALRDSFTLNLYPNQREVKKQIQWIKSHPSYLRILTKQAKPYLYFVFKRVRKYHLPGEIALLPMIESAYNPFAYSGVGAAGLWQLMPGTGTGLGLRQDWWYDGRRGIHTSTTAALKYLKYLNKFFNGNWTLAIAAYDSGEGTVKRALTSKQQTTTNANFWSLNLPKETKAYIPRLLALALVIKYPKYYGIKLPELPYEEYFAKIEVDRQIDLTHAAQLAGISYSELIKLNPGYNRWATAPDRPHTLVLPIDKVTQFKANLDKVPTEKLVTWQRHRVKSGETLSQIALKYRTRITLIKSINKLTSNVIKLNQVLLIPSTKHLSVKTITETQRKQAINHASSKGPKKIIHVVKPGESFASIENRYHTKAAAIRYWNKITNNRLVPGQKLIIWQRRSRAKTHRVKVGESLSVIAQKYQTRVKHLQRLNPVIKNGLIKPNQVIKLA